MITDLNNNNYIFHLQTNITTDLKDNNHLCYLQNNMIPKFTYICYFHNNVITYLNNNNYIFHFQNNITTDLIIYIIFRIT